MFKKVIGMLFATVAALTMSVAVFASSADNSGLLDLSLSQEEAASRGFQIIDGNIYELDGTLLFVLDEYGFTQYGFRLDERFALGNQVPSSNAPEPRNGISFVTGTHHANLNVNGTQGRAVGQRNALTSALPNITVTYSSGTPTGLNVSVRNVNNGNSVGWVSNVAPGNDAVFNAVFNNLTSSTQFEIIISAEGRAGSVTLNGRATS